MDSDQTIGVCGPKLIDYNNRDKFEYAGAAGGYIDKYGYPFCRGRLFEYLETDNGQHDTREDCLWISGAALFIRAKLFFEVGGLKRSSSLWINERRLVPGKFSWQSGYGAFTYNKQQISNVANYIENQEEHHKTKKFRDEYENLLREFGIEYDDRYIFHEIQ